MPGVIQCSLKLFKIILACYSNLTFIFKLVTLVIIANKAAFIFLDLFHSIHHFPSVSLLSLKLQHNSDKIHF